VSIYQSIEMLAKEKGIDPQVIFDAVKDAVLVAARKQFRANENMAIDFNEKGDIELYLVKTVVEQVNDPLNEVTPDQARKLQKGLVPELGMEVRLAKKADALGRISAQTAKQVILQKIREAERENVFSEFTGRVGELGSASKPATWWWTWARPKRVCRKKNSRAWRTSPSASACVVSSRAWKRAEKTRACWFPVPPRNW